MKSCVRCLLPETADATSFDAEGVCSVCRQHEVKHEKIDWVQRRADLETLVAPYRGHGNYDCIIPFSGGKDSTFQAWFAVTQLNLKPLIVRFNHTFYRPTVQENVKNALAILGVDMMEFTPSRKVVAKVMMEALIRRGDFCWHCHTGVYAWPMQMAVKMGIKLLVWGESLAEYQSFYSYDEMEEVDEKRFNRAMNLGMTADDMALFTGLPERDLSPFKYPPRKDLRDVRSVCLGSYIKWDTLAQVRIIKKELGWKGDTVEGIPARWDYEKIECSMQGVRDYLKFIKRGMGRTNHLANIEIRAGRMTREEGAALAAEYDGKEPKSLIPFCEMLGITKEQFYEIAMEHQVDPWKNSLTPTPPADT